MIKNTFFLIGLLLICNIKIGNAQNTDTLKMSLELLQKSKEFRFPADSSGFSNFRASKFLLPNGGAVPFPIDPKNIHIVDFNNDGQKDIIFQNKFRYGTTLLFVNKDNNFKVLWSGAGTLVAITEGANPTMYVRNNPIGCFNNTQLMALTVHEDNTISENFIAYHDDTDIKDLDKALIKNSISGILRTQPIVDDTITIDPCTGDTVTGNQVRTIENDIVIILKKMENWLLVIHESKGTHIICWIQIMS
jgi:hypothetical protein